MTIESKLQILKDHGITAWQKLGSDEITAESVSYHAGTDTLSIELETLSTHNEIMQFLGY